MKYTPHEYQQFCEDFLIDKPAAGLLLDMGLGKTVITLTTVARWMYDRFEINKVLVVAPLRVAEDTWTKESAKWDHLQGLRVVRVLGTEAQRIRALQTDADIYCINRENIPWLVKYYGARWPFDGVVLDELSSFKSAGSKRFKALRRKLGCIKRIVGLTGTPAPNGLIDLWPQIYLLDRGERLGKTLGAFRSKWFVPDRSNGHIVYSYRQLPGAAEDIKSRLSDLCMSLSKEDWLSLPGQVYEDVVIPPPPELLRKYRKFEREKVLEALDDNGDIVALNAAALTNKLLQFANGAVYDQEGGVHELHTLKLDALEDLIEGAGGESVLVFYAFKHDRDRIMQRIECRELKSQASIDDWNEGRIHVALAHPASVGHGLNLQAGGHIIVWFGLTWSLELYQQANERLNRPGQTHMCRIYHLVLQGTHDERVLRALADKDTNQTGLLTALKQSVLIEPKEMDDNCG